MSRPSGTVSTGGGGGCLMFFVLVALIAGAYAYSQGMDPREAVGYGLEAGAWAVGGLCVLVAGSFALALAVKVLASR